MKNMFKGALILFFVAVITVSFVTVVRGLTLAPIEEQQNRVREAALNNVLPQAEFFAEYQGLFEGNVAGFFEGFVDGGQVAGYVISLSVPGYSGLINLMLGIDAENETISGMRILSHTETPGLGALIVRDSFYSQFEGMNLEPLRLSRTTAGPGEIDIITGATITVRAVVDAVNEGIEWFADWRAE